MVRKSFGHYCRTSASDRRSSSICSGGRALRQQPVVQQPGCMPTRRSSKRWSSVIRDASKCSSHSWAPLRHGRCSVPSMLLEAMVGSQLVSSSSHMPKSICSISARRRSGLQAELCRAARPSAFPARGKARPTLRGGGDMSTIHAHASVIYYLCCIVFARRPFEGRLPAA